MWETDSEMFRFLLEAWGDENPLRWAGFFHLRTWDHFELCGLHSKIVQKHNYFKKYGK